MIPQATSVPQLSATGADAVRGLHEAALRTDGVAPLSEQSLLALGSPHAGVRHLLRYAGDLLAGYAQTAPGGAAELVVRPGHRRRGVGTGLWAELTALEPAVGVWAHGTLPAARGFAVSLGLTSVRELHKLSRPLTPDDEQDPTLPVGFRVRPFVPGQDEQAWLEANAAAFASHPEQGRLVLGDLQERMAQPWFDPVGLLLVQDEHDAGHRVAAFHWTKVDPAQRSSLDPARAAGEVYVLGVHPAYQGRGLAGPLTRLGLAHLARLGLPEVVLYVDGDNAAALHTYSRAGFRSIMVDTMYQQQVAPTRSG